MRLAVSLAVLTGGTALGFVSYFGLAAKLGTPTDQGFSNPAVPYAASLFVVGVILVFLAPLIYELFPERVDR